MVVTQFEFYYFGPKIMVGLLVSARQTEQIRYGAKDLPSLFSLMVIDI